MLDTHFYRPPFLPKDYDVVQSNLKWLNSGIINAYLYRAFNLMLRVPFILDNFSSLSLLILTPWFKIEKWNRTPLLASGKSQLAEGRIFSAT